MRTVIVTPLYYISKAFEETVIHARNKGNEVLVIITDDLSPLFPLLNRQTWVENVFMDKSIYIDSMKEHDEDPSFISALKTKLVHLLGRDPYELIISFTHPVEYKAKYTQLADMKEMDSPRSEMFDIRYGKEWEELHAPKEYTPTAEVRWIPTFEENNTRFYGFVYNYTTRKNETLNINNALEDTTIGDVMRAAEAITKLWFEVEPIQTRYLGTLPDMVEQGEYYLTKLSAKPTFIDYNTPLGMRMFVDKEHDLIFFSEHDLPYVLPPFGLWVLDKMKPIIEIPLE